MAFYADRSVSSYAAATPVVAENSSRRILKIVPPADCLLTLTSGAAFGEPLYGGVANTFEGNECPANALYITGLTAGVAITIWEA